MRGRTNISSGGMSLNATVEEFVVGSGGNVVAGDFVQFCIEESNQKHDNSGYYMDYFYQSGNRMSKVIPLGNDKYIMWYTNDGRVFLMSLVDVRGGFKILSTTNFENGEYIPDCCYLADGNIAVCYMEMDNEFTIKIYKTENKLSLLGTYKKNTDRTFKRSISNIVQLDDSRIVVACCNNSIICSYSGGAIGGISYQDLGLEEGAYSLLPDWPMAKAGGNKVFVLSSYKASSTGSAQSSLNIIEIADPVRIIKKELTAGNYLNRALWGNMYSLGGRLLFSDGFKDFDPNNTNASAEGLYKTRIYYVDGNEPDKTQDIDLLLESMEEFGVTRETEVSHKTSSGTAQYVKENVFYAAVEAKLSYKDSRSNKTVIFRAEYNEESGMFERSNFVSISLGESGTHAGYGKFFESEDGDVYYLYETEISNATKIGRWIMRMTYRNGVLEKGGNTKLVEQYSEGTAIGVAKESGVSGQKIEVYVATPKNS